MWNPLYDTWRFYQPWSIEAEQWHPERTKDYYDARRRATQRWAWAVPTAEVIHRIAALGPVVEVGAGTGYWARLLADAGADVVAYDAQPPKLLEGVIDVPPRSTTTDVEFNWWHHHARCWFDVHVGLAEVAGEHPDRTLLICWPPFDTPLARDALTAYVEAGGTRVVYVGEGASGCTGDDEFHGMIDSWWCSDCLEEECRHKPAPTCRPVDVLGIPQWDGIRDYVQILEVVR